MTVSPSSNDAETIVVSMSTTRDLISALDEVIELRGYHSRSQALRDAITDFIRKYNIHEGPPTEAIMTIIVRVIDPISFDQELSKLTYNDVEHNILTISTKTKEEKHIRILIVEGEITRMSELIGQIRALRGVESMEFTILPME